MSERMPHKQELAEKLCTATNSTEMDDRCIIDGHRDDNIGTTSSTDEVQHDGRCDKNDEKKQVGVIDQSKKTQQLNQLHHLQEQQYKKDTLMQMLGMEVDHLQISEESVEEKKTESLSRKHFLADDKSISYNEELPKSSSIDPESKCRNVTALCDIAELTTGPEPLIEKRLSTIQIGTNIIVDANLDINRESKQFAFWSTQPVPKLHEDVTTNECIEPNKDITEIRAEPYALPNGFKWDTLDLNSSVDLTELYTLLNENYVEDDDAMFRFDYQPEFLKWSLQSPGWRRDWHLGVRVVKSGRLVGFISAIPSTLRAYDKILKVVEINFLCVHKKLRSKRVAPVLIREITRRVNLKGIFQAAYTAGVVLPKPLATCRYWHRSLNPKKLIEVKFSHLARNMTMQRTIKLYKLPDKPKTKGYRRIEPKDMIKTRKLLDEYLKQFILCPIFSDEEFRHWFTPKDGVVDCFIVEDSEGNITDMTSFYCLPSSVMHHPVHKSLRGAYSFYNVSTKTPWLELINDALVSAKNIQMDVYNALDLMENKKFLMSLKFGQGDGNLQYYLYNWRCPSMKPQDVALILM